MRTPLIRLLPVLLAMYVSATAVFAQVRVTVANVPSGVSVQAILNAGNDSKPLTPAERSGGTLTFAMLADSANFGKPVQVYLVREEEDDDRPVVVFFIIDNGAVPPNGRLLDTFTLTALTTDILIDYQTGRVTARQTEEIPGATRPLFGRGWQFGVYGDWINFTNAGGDDICETAPPGSTVAGCDLDKSGGGLAFSAGYQHRWSSVGLGVDVAYGTASKVTLKRTITNTANPNLTATQDFRFDPKTIEVLGRVGVWVTPRTQLSVLGGGAHITSRTTNTFDTRAGGTVVNTQTTTTDNGSWSPVIGGSMTVWANRWLGFEAGYRWLRLKDGDVNEPMHKWFGGLRLNVGPH